MFGRPVQLPVTLALGLRESASLVDLAGQSVYRGMPGAALHMLCVVFAQDQKGTLVIALATLGAQTMEPILEGWAPHAHYQAPVFDSLVVFDHDKGGIGPGVAEH